MPAFGVRIVFGRLVPYPSVDISFAVDLAGGDNLAPVPFARCPLYVCIGAVRQRPVVVDGEVVARPVLVLTATADHRIIDGAQAARLAAFLRTALAAPATLDAPLR